jgi:nucleotide-binding universal stress UspA family protein
MKTILVPIEPHDAIQSVLETALLLGRKFNSYIEGFALRPAIGNLVTMDPVSSLTVVSARENDAEIVRQARGIFETFMRDQAVPPPRAGGAGASLSQAWHEATPDGDEIVGSYGRVFDITVLGAPLGGRQGPRMMTLETALFESGRPVLIAPATAPLTMGESILLAWNCSTEQARATASAMPLLRKSARVVVCTVEGATVPGPSGDEIARYLRRHEVPAEAITINPAPQKPGEAIMAKAKELGCDLVVKGAYTQSRLRQMIFGGATQYILTHATLPVLLAH